MNILKLIITSFVLSIAFVVSTFAQTTQEEYNYLTKGYKVQIESGLDMKKGYSLIDLNSQSIQTGSVERKCTFKALVKEGEKKPCAILCMYTRSDNNFSDYLCIPTYDAPKDIWDQAFVKINTYSETGATALIWGLSKLASYYSTN